MYFIVLYVFVLGEKYDKINKINRLLRFNSIIHLRTLDSNVTNLLNKYYNLPRYNTQETLIFSAPKYYFFHKIILYDFRKFFNIF